MTGTGSPFSNSQEVELLHGCTNALPGWHEYKDLKDQINMNPYQYPMENLSQGMNNQAFINSNNYEDQQSSDGKYPLQSPIGMLQQSTVTPILGKEEFAGSFNFQLILNCQIKSKHWVYSEKLSKVFIHMEEVLPVQFQWTPPTSGLWWVRATMVYKLDQYRSQPITRCHNHMAPDNNSNRTIDPKYLKHVVRCLNNTSTYDDANGHPSVLVPLGTTMVGVNNVPMDFVFCCKNSCTSGINRRATEVIFTLENAQSQILGRRKLEVRVCSCPKRDKVKEENEIDASTNVQSYKKRKIVSIANLPPGKKLATDNAVYALNLNIVGRDNAQAIIKYAHDVMAGSALKSGNLEQCKPYMDELLKKCP